MTSISASEYRNEPVRGRIMICGDGHAIGLREAKWERRGAHSESGSSIEVVSTNSDVKISFGHEEDVCATRHDWDGRSYGCPNGSEQAKGRGETATVHEARAKL